MIILSETKGIVGAIFLFGCFILTPLYIAARPALPRHLLKQVHVGMPANQVRKMLGNHQAVPSQNEWEYWRWGNSGWVEIRFDEQNCVSSVNDESAF